MRLLSFMPPSTAFYMSLMVLTKMVYASIGTLYNHYNNQLFEDASLPDWETRIFNDAMCFGVRCCTNLDPNLHIFANPTVT
jgi:hypothetical protein